MKLLDLDAEFIRWKDIIDTWEKVAPGFETATAEGSAAWKNAGFPTVQHTGVRTYIVSVDALSDAQGVMLNCPKCRNHMVQIAFAGRGVADHHGLRSSDGSPTRWTVVSGTALDDLTLTPSIDCTPSNPNCWHGFITNGEAT